MKRILKFAGAGLALFLAIDVSATDLPDFPFLVSTGEAVREIEPDMATLSVSVLAFNKDPELAVEELGAAFGQALEILSKHQVPIDAVEASDLRRSVTRARNSDHQSLEILGYQLSRSIMVQLDDLATYPEMAEELAAVPNISSIDATFDVADRKQVEEELLAEASAHAIRKAELMAEGFGQEVDSVYAISQASNFNAFFATFGASSHGYAFADAPRQGFRNAMSMFVPEVITIRQQINAVLRIDED